MGNLVLQGDNQEIRLAFKNELTLQGGNVVSSSISLDDNGNLVSEGRYKIITGIQGASVDVANQENGSIHFTNGSGGAAVPVIVAKSTQNTGLVITASTQDAPASGRDMQFNVVNNSDTAHTVTTQTAYSFSVAGSEKLGIRRNGALALYNFSATASAGGSYSLNGYNFIDWTQISIMRLF